MSRAASSIKAASPMASGGRKPRLTWSDVLRVVQGSKTRQRVFDAYRARGFTPDDFATLKAARESMADALTRAEDWLELLPGKHAVKAARSAIAGVRRQLELELWP